MEYIASILGAITGLVFFLCLIKAYLTGVKHGKELVKGNVPQTNLNPIKSFKEYVEKKEEKKKVDFINEGWNGPYGINNYDPYNVAKEGD